MESFSPFEEVNPTNSFIRGAIEPVWITLRPTDECGDKKQISNQLRSQLLRFPSGIKKKKKGSKIW